MYFIKIMSFCREFSVLSSKKRITWFELVYVAQLINITSSWTKKSVQILGLNKKKCSTRSNNHTIKNSLINNNLKRNNI